MSKKIVRDSGSEQSLALLLDGLATEILATPDHEVAVVLWNLDATGRNAMNGARRLVISLNESPDTAEAPEGIANGQRVHLKRITDPAVLGDS